MFNKERKVFIERNIFLNIGTHCCRKDTSGNGSKRTSEIIEVNNEKKNSL